MCYFRLLISAHLQRNADHFVHFLPAGMSVKQFCAKEVEPMRVESDQYHIIALASEVGNPSLNSSRLPLRTI